MKSTPFESLFKEGWRQYCEITPDALRVKTLLGERGEHAVNDHVAFRTFDLPGISRLELGAHFEAQGFRRREDMDFPEKKLRATYWLHPDPRLPKIFISELLLASVSPALRDWIADLFDSRLPAARSITADTFLGESWPRPAFADYQKFYGESEYAAWTAAFGIRANHFTLFVNSLTSFQSIAELNAFLQAQGLVLNSSGGEIKGSRAEGLEQSSTMARRVPWIFAGGETVEIMSCYYEFAERFALRPGEALFQGFIPKSADKIFESTYE